jgi:hypothetical protein
LYDTKDVTRTELETMAEGVNSVLGQNMGPNIKTKKFVDFEIFLNG